MSAIPTLDAPAPTVGRRCGRLTDPAALPRTIEHRACPLCASIEPPPQDAASAFVTCCNCGLLYRAGVHTLPEIDYWDGYEQDEQEQAYDARRQAFFRAYWRRLRRLPRRGAARPSMLDVGCVPGQLLMEAAADGWETHGVELSSRLASITRRNVDARMWIGHVEDLDFGGRQFDLVVITDTFRHLAHPLAALRRGAAALRPGGALVIRELDASHGRHASRLGAPYVYDMQFVTPRTLRRFLRHAGLAEIRLLNSPVSLLTIRRFAALAARRPRLFEIMRRSVNLGIRMVDPLTAGRGRSVTPSFVMAGFRRGPAASDDARRTVSRTAESRCA